MTVFELLDQVREEHSLAVNVTFERKESYRGITIYKFRLWDHEFKFCTYGPKWDHDREEYNPYQFAVWYYSDC